MSKDPIIKAISQKKAFCFSCQKETCKQPDFYGHSMWFCVKCQMIQWLDGDVALHLGKIIYTHEDWRHSSDPYLYWYKSKETCSYVSEDARNILLPYNTPYNISKERLYSLLVFT